MFLRSLIVFLIVMAGIAVFQAHRNNCYWGGIADLPEWVFCAGTVRW